MELLDQQLSRGEIEAAAARIRAFVRRTPVLVVDGADLALPGIRVAFKLEFTQHSGSFKARGAFNNLLSRAVPAAGVVAASGGNHGVAVAFAAMRLKHPATIFVPNVASRVKIEQIRASGATLEISGERYADALAASEEFAQRSGALRVHAFDQVETLLGQATVGVELEQDGPALDALLVAVGGGGLIGGIAAWYRGRVPLIGVEPEEAPQLRHALAAGAPIDAPTGGIAADSLAPRRVGGLMFPIAQRFVADSVLVSDEAIRVAQRTLWDLLRVVVEPGGAAAFAALQSGAWKPAAGQTIGVLLCGA
ncbi:MAG TPA: threonine/serine dehydratase, partial [Steroidobacteraceae bacterium]|nr:threonine/serine dehydratase [Steroidobacteraceae bacterium]